MKLPGGDTFLAAVAELGRIQREIVLVSAAERDGWRRDLIELRRALQAQITLVSQTIDERAADDALREALNQMRSKVALHQANWPAVAIDRADPAYRASVQDVRAANNAFMALAERARSEPRASDQ